MNMAHEIKENKNMAPSALLREEDDNVRGGDDNNQAVEKNRDNNRMRSQQTLQQRLDQLRAENKMLEEKFIFLVKEMRFLKKLIIAIAGTSLDLSGFVLLTLLSETTSDIPIGK